jgi:hypothetical protein
MRRTPLLTLLCAFLLLAFGPASFLAAPPQEPAKPPIEKKVAPAPPEHAAASIRFAVMGDTGTGDKYQYAVSKQMVAEYDRDPFQFVLMLGDNNYRGSFSKQVGAVFEKPYAKLLESGVKFYATLGNHDQQSANEEMSYGPFNMNGKRSYSFTPAGDLVEFFTIDSTPVVEANDTAELEWLDKALEQSKARWKIVFIHHPPFSPGKRHGDNPILEQRLCPILQKRGVRIVMTGHEHFFAKMRENNGVDYIISGSGGKIHTGGILPDPRMEAGNDALHQFLSVTLSPNVFEYTVIAETGAVLYRGTIPYQRAAAAAN